MATVGLWLLGDDRLTTVLTMTGRYSSSLGSLPTAVSDFVGRERELDKIAKLLLDSTRLITLIGSGGIGKTRLATEAVHRYHKARRVPVHWVRLARLAGGADKSAVEDEVAQAIVDADFSDRSVWAALVDTLTRSDAVGHRLQTILVMDNCEHVLDGAGRLIAELLDAVPGLTVLATSREAVSWVDEQLVPIGPLSREQALGLFRKRAELTGRAIADDQLALADSICRHVDNHPLYIRLAAARLRHQPLPMILRDLSGEHSDRRLRWSRGPRVGTEERHQGIRDVIAWSYDLCTDQERLLFDRMSVFAAGYDVDPDDESDTSVHDVGAELDAIEGVCADLDIAGGDPRVSIATDEIEGLLERLADQSLVSVHLTSDTVRYSLLESFQVFAQQRLRERSAGAEWERLTARHRRYYRDKVMRACAEWFSPAEQDLLDWARAAWDNLLCAIDGSLTTPGESVIGLEIAVGLISLRVPFIKGSLRESRRWAERTLAATRELDPQPVELQISAIALIGWISMCQGLHDDAERMLEECVAACVTDPTAQANWRHAPERDRGLPAPVEFTRGSELMLVQSDARAVAVLGCAREKFTARGDLGGAAMSELFEALAAGFCGTAAQAIDIARRHLDNATAAGAGWAKSWAELAWAIALTKYGDPEEALAVGRSALADQVAMRDQWGALWAVHVRMWTLARMSADARPMDGAASEQVIARATEIALLGGGVATWRQRLGVNMANLGPFETETDNAIDIAREVLGHKLFEATQREGAMLRPEQGEVARLALGTLSMDKLEVDHPIRRDRPSPWQELSTAEQEVATLAAAGWTNTAIAASRGSSFKTIDAQMVSIFQKLTITSRADIITFVPADRQSDVTNAAARRPKRAQRGR
ncbi:LuxR C-terminal-related transcriptional regulator [Nocardia vinacea]|uniref:LuxR C-terminal-related transcriptional regulator n=1 Tax=Nocardia vinacea TaxID=96468 RepID=A0ABZ1YLV2_9NOCA|nr:AAA family ATPase [Nocardia vinacea]